RLARHPVQAADLVPRAPGALRHLDAAAVEHGIRDELFVARHRSSFGVVGLDPYSLRLLDQRAVELGSPVAEEVELVLAGDDVVLVTRQLEVDLADEQRLLALVRLREALAVRVDDLAPAAELAPALFADAVRGQEVDAVLGGARDRDQLGLDL